jgi:hypothetical protein
VQTSKERERHLFHLAGLLLFEVEKQGDSFTLTRTADTETPLHQGGLSLEEAEEVLNTWKLRGLHGG